MWVAHLGTSASFPRMLLSIFFGAFSFSPGLTLVTFSLDEWNLNGKTLRNLLRKLDVLISVLQNIKCLLKTFNRKAINCKLNLPSFPSYIKLFAREADFGTLLDTDRSSVLLLAYSSIISAVAWRPQNLAHKLAGKRRLVSVSSNEAPQLIEIISDEMILE